MMHQNFAAPGYDLNLNGFITSPGPGQNHSSPAFAPLPKWCDVQTGSSHEEPSGQLQDAIMKLLAMYIPTTPPPASLDAENMPPPVTPISLDHALTQEKPGNSGTLGLLGLLPPPGLGAKVDLETFSTPPARKPSPGWGNNVEFDAYSPPLPKRPDCNLESRKEFELATPLLHGLQPPASCFRRNFDTESFCSASWHSTSEQSSQSTQDSPNYSAKDGHGRGDPELSYARELAAAGHGLSGYKTIMIQQVPFKYTQSELMNEINQNGFEGTYDFLYLPVDARNPGNRGFGFINFLSAALAEKFYQTYSGKKFSNYEPTTALGVIPADVQGFEQSAATFFASWHLRKKNRHSKPVFLRPVPAHIRQEGWHKGKSNTCDAYV